MNIIKLTKNNHSEVIQKAIKVLDQGGIVIYPTETCYGVGVDATNPDAVKKLLKYKNRPIGKPISIAVTDQAMASNYVRVNETAKNLYANFLPGPITVISESLNKVAEGITAEDNSLGVRIPNYSFTIELIKQFGKPITATSANLSGRKTPYTISDILDNASDKNKKLIDLIIDVGELPKNPPSTVVDTRLNDERVIRKGKHSLNSQRAKTKDQNHSLQTITHTTNTAEETQDFGEKLMKDYMNKLKNKCIIFALQGDLGAGKTQFAKGVAHTLGIQERITSPTYTIVQEYEFGKSSKLFHIDTWRMEEGARFDDIGFKDMIKPGNVLVIEWMEKVGKMLKDFETNKSIQLIWITIAENKQKQRLLSVSI